MDSLVVRVLFPFAGCTTTRRVTGSGTLHSHGPLSWFSLSLLFNTSSDFGGVSMSLTWGHSSSNEVQTNRVWRKELKRNRKERGATTWPS